MVSSSDINDIETVKYKRVNKITDGKEKINNLKYSQVILIKIQWLNVTNHLIGGIYILKVNG